MAGENYQNFWAFFPSCNPNWPRGIMYVIFLLDLENITSSWYKFLEWSSFPASQLCQLVVYSRNLAVCRFSVVVATCKLSGRFDGVVRGQETSCIFPLKLPVASSLSVLPNSDHCLQLVRCQPNAPPETTTTHLHEENAGREPGGVVAREWRPGWRRREQLPHLAVVEEYGLEEVGW